MTGPVLVLGLTEIASAAAHALAAARRPVALHADAPPKTHRRLMSFADAWWDGEAVLDDRPCRRMEAAEFWGAIPLLTSPLQAVLAATPWAALVDARLRKRAPGADLRGLAPVSIGLGPGQAAGETCDLALETQWGDRLGAVIANGPTAALSGEPQAIAGVGRERLVYAAVPGTLETFRAIGDSVVAGHPLGRIGSWSFHAPNDGVVRGLVRAGVAVETGDKLAEVDPRPPGRAVWRGIGERPRRVAAGVVAALCAKALD